MEVCVILITSKYFLSSRYNIIWTNTPFSLETLNRSEHYRIFWSSTLALEYILYVYIETQTNVKYNVGIHEWIKHESYRVIVKNDEYMISYYPKFNWIKWIEEIIGYYHANHKILKLLNLLWGALILSLQYLCL